MDLPLQTGGAQQGHAYLKKATHERPFRIHASSRKRHTRASHRSPGPQSHVSIEQVAQLYTRELAGSQPVRASPAFSPSSRPERSARSCVNAVIPRILRRPLLRGKSIHMRLYRLLRQTGRHSPRSSVRMVVAVANSTLTLEGPLCEHFCWQPGVHRDRSGPPPALRAVWYRGHDQCDDRPRDRPPVWLWIRGHAGAQYGQSGHCRTPWDRPRWPRLRRSTKPIWWARDGEPS